MSFDASEIATRLGSHLLIFAEARKLGRVVVEGLCHMPVRRDPRRRRRPDVLYISAQRRPFDQRTPPPQAALEIPPDLAVEVISPNDLASEVNIRVREYFAAGVQRVGSSTRWCV